MSTRFVALLLIGALALAPSLVALDAPSDAGLEEGIRQTQLGDFEKAVVTLDSAARRLAAEGGRSDELARAYVYLSIAYLGLSQEQKAKAQFLEALKADSDMKIDEGEFPPRVLEFFEEAREEALAEGAVEPTSPAPPEAPAVSEPEPSGEPVSEPATVADTETAAPEPEKKGGSTKWLLLGGLAAAGVGVAAAAGGGGGGNGASGGTAPAPTPPAVEEWVEKFSAQVPRPIPDLNQAFSQLNFGPVGTIVEAQLEFRIRHTCRRDLWMELRHPDGTTYTAEGPADCRVVNLWEGPIGVPAEGKASNGTWSLTVMDREAEDQGTLEVWGLRLRIRR
jgi:hypothetical protein